MRPEDQLVRACADAFSVDNTLQTRSRDLMHPRGHLKGKPLRHRSRDDRAGHDMLRRLLQGSGKSKDVFGTFSRPRLDRDQTRPAHGQRSGLVKEHGVRLRQGI